MLKHFPNQFHYHIHLDIILRFFLFPLPSLSMYLKIWNLDHSGNHSLDEDHSDNHSVMT